MTAPDFDGLETSLRNLRGAISCLQKMADGIHQSTPEAAGLEWLAASMERDLVDAHSWFEAAHEANVAAKATGPVAV